MLNKHLYRYSELFKNISSFKNYQLRIYRGKICNMKVIVINKRQTLLEIMHLVSFHQSDVLYIANVPLFMGYFHEQRLRFSSIFSNGENHKTLSRCGQEVDLCAWSATPCHNKLCRGSHVL